MSFGLSSWRACFAISIVALLAALPGGWESARADVVRPTLHELAAIESRGARLWYHEEEFSRHPLLRAEPHHVVILHLEAGDHKGKRILNTIPYRFTETAEYRFCIPDDDPHIRSIELRRDGRKGNGVEVHVPRGAGCKTRTIEAGLYRLHVEHDGSRIGAAGEKAFIHVPRKGNLQAGSTLSTFPGACDPDAQNNPMFTFVATDGRFMNTNPLQTAPIPVSSVTGGVSDEEPLYLLGWNICADSDGYVTFSNWRTAPPLKHAYSWFSHGPSSSDTRVFLNLNVAGSPVTRFKINDLGNGQFTLAANFDGTLYPIIYGSDRVLHWASPGTAPAIFSITLKYYPNTTPQVLQQGEIALFPSCNYPTTHGTWVFTRDVPDIFPYLNPNFFVTSNSSIKLGPQTEVLQYPNPNYDGLAQVISADNPCPNPPLASHASFRVIPPIEEFIVSSKGCQYCNLSGVDLSGLDLTRFNFTHSVFNHANLTNTNFQSAILDYATFRSYASEGGPVILTGTDFVGASLFCSDFQASDLRNAFFWLASTSSTPAVLPVITKDFSCRLQLQYGTLKLATFPVDDWRYLLLSGANIPDASGQVLSSTSKPLDLSRATMNGTAGLTHVDLSGANLAGANFTGTNLTGANLHKVTTIDPASGASSPATFTGAKLDSAALDYAILDGALLNNASLAKAYLKRVSLKNALLQGVNLSSSNLDGANFCDAKLNQSPDKNLSAILDGAFLRNINLSGADLTGASLVNASLYSSAPASAATCNPASCGFSSTCASAVNAHLGNTDFTDAYLAGVDFSGSFPQSANFAGATLSGSNFTNANLTQDVSTGKRTNFTDSFLQGTIFSNAVVTGANFTGAVVDLSHSSGQTIKEQLDPQEFLTFPGYTPSSGSTPGCVQFTTNRETVLPQTDNSNVCPNSGSGPCTTAQWQAIAQQPPPACNLDFNWIFATY